MKKFIKICIDFGNQLKEDNLNSYASSCAFFIFLSLIPMIMLLFSIIPYTPIDPVLVTTWIKDEFPAGTGSILVSILEEVSERSVGIVSVTAIATLWSAGKGINSLRAGFNAIDNYVDKRNTILLRIISSLYTLIFLAGIVFLLILLVGGNFFKENILDLFPNLGKVFAVLINFRSLISIVLLSIIMMLCYSLIPYKKHKFRETFPGAIVSSLAWTGFSYLFSFYINRFDAFSMYGSLTAIIILMFWLYAGMYIMFIGDNLNKYFRPVIVILFQKGSKIKDVKGQFKNLH